MGIVITCERLPDFWLLSIQHADGDPDGGDNPCATGRSLPETLRELANTLERSAVVAFEKEHVIPYHNDPTIGLRAVAR